MELGELGTSPLKPEAVKIIKGRIQGMQETLIMLERPLLQGGLEECLQLTRLINADLDVMEAFFESEIERERGKDSGVDQTRDLPRRNQRHAKRSSDASGTYQQEQGPPLEADLTGGMESRMGVAEY